MFKVNGSITDEESVSLLSSYGTIDTTPVVDSSSSFNNLTLQYQTSDNSYRPVSGYLNRTTFSIELKIPDGQILYTNVQGNWGYRAGSAHFNIYRDGTASDGCIYQTSEGVRHKYLVPSGALVRWDVTPGEVNIFINNEKVLTIADNVNLSQMNQIGNGSSDYNNLQLSDGRGRRPVEFIKLYY